MSRTTKPKSITPAQTQPDTTWYVYILRCADRSLYTGITTSLSRRMAQHNSSGKACAKYTRTRQPVTLVYCEKWASRSQAAQREHGIKKLPKADKEALVFQKKHKNSDYLSFLMDNSEK